MATTIKMTMADFANECEYPVLFWVSIGCPTGDYAPLGYPDWSLPDGWDATEGAVDADGDWNWDGGGHVSDWNRNSVRRLLVYSDKAKWESLVKDYESEY